MIGASTKPSESVAVARSQAPTRCRRCGAPLAATSTLCDNCGQPTGAGVSPGQWDRPIWFVAAMLLSLGPLALPWVWFHPRYSPSAKGWVTVGVLLFTVGLCALLVLAIWFLFQQIQQLTA
jgi:ribosomal protein L37E